MNIIRTRSRHSSIGDTASGTGTSPPRTLKSSSSGKLSASSSGNSLYSTNTVACYITDADNRIYNVEVDQKAIGQDCLDKISRLLGIVEESDYFGLQFFGQKKELLWVNMRNILAKQIPGNPPYNLFLRVKFYAPCHTLLLEDTRHQFYLNIVQQLKQGYWIADMNVDLHSQLIAQMAQAKFGNYNSTAPYKYACFWPDGREWDDIPANMIQLAAEQHRILENSSKAHIEYELIRVVSMELPLYGYFFYDVKDIFENRLLVGVGPEGLCLCTVGGKVIEKFPFCRIQRVIVTARVVSFALVDDEGLTKSVNYQLVSNRAAQALYRSVTEMHSFFRCDTVRDDVVGQTNRDLKGTFVSLFDPSAASGKAFMFDVRRTCREVYDQTRRRLHSCSSNTNTAACPASVPAPIVPQSPVDSTSKYSPQASGVAAPSSRTDSVVSAEEAQEIRSRLGQLRDSFLCRICRDQPINRVFFPCGHSITCAACADRIDQCPVCRESISLRHVLYPPWELQEAGAIFGSGSLRCGPPLDELEEETGADVATRVIERDSSQDSMTESVG